MNIKDFVKSCGVLELSEKELEDFQKHLYELKIEKKYPEKIKKSEEIKERIQKDFDVLAKFFPYEMSQDIAGYANEYHSSFYGFRSEENTEIRAIVFLSWDNYDDCWQTNYRICYRSSYLNNEFSILPKSRYIENEPGHLTEEMVKNTIGELVSWLKSVHQEIANYLEEIGEEIT